MSRRDLKYCLFEWDGVALLCSTVDLTRSDWQFESFEIMAPYKVSPVLTLALR
jgi:hypothetical protein